ncbi:hypothetical protein D3C78_1761300 [compost metagenome]
MNRQHVPGQQIGTDFTVVCFCHALQAAYRALEHRLGDQEVSGQRLRLQLQVLQ